MHSTDNLNDSYIGSGTRLWHSINYHGRENHSMEILEYLDNRDLLKLRERELINEDMLKDPMCMNLKVGGEGGGFTEAQYKKGAHTMLKKIWNDPEFRKRKSISSSKNIKHLLSEGIIKAPDWTGRKHSDETKKKMSESSNNKGSKNSQFGTCWIYNEIESKKIKKEEIVYYLKSGWNKGRKLNF